MAIQHGVIEKLELDFGKLFIGGISWDTDESRLKEYFGSYGEVVEAVIMRDRVTGRARGFGFVVFVDPAVAERVVMEKHMIDGRTDLKRKKSSENNRGEDGIFHDYLYREVEAKKAVPREDHHGLNRTNSSIQGSPGPGGRTKKIFVGGLASTVTESDFKKYFDQFGGITDVVVMYDHNTQRPRGFGFITFDSEEAVDRVLHKTFHELNGKMVEVKRAVPKELSPGPNRSPLVGFNYGLTRPNAFLANTYPQGYNMSPIGGYGGRADSRFGPIAGRNGFSPFGSSGYGMGINLDPSLSPGAFGGNSNNMGYGRVLSPYFGGNSNRYITPIGYNQSNVRNESFIGSSTRNVWGNGGLTSPNGSGAYLGSGNGGFGVFGNGPNWGSSPISTQGGMNSIGYNDGSVGPLGGPENNYGLTIGRNGPNVGHEVSYGNLYRGGSMYGDPTWRSSSNELDGSGSGSFGYGLDNSEDVGNYSIANRQTNRGIAA